MDCGLQSDTVSTERVDELARRAYRDRVPVNGSFDLTCRCNFRCRHCYAAHLVAQSRARAEELQTEEVRRLLSDAARAGCLFLLLSGGEPLMRDDFVEIYTEAARLGFVITAFTNASMIGPEHLAVFSEYPPHLVEVSLYGASEATCERVTGVAGAYRLVRQNIDLLLARGVRVGLKTMVLTDNVEEVPAIEALAEESGLRFRMDPLVTPRLDGDLGPLAQRVDPERAVEIELSNDERRAKTAEYLRSRCASAAPRGESANRLYRCGAGAVGFHVDPQGVMRPCMMSRDLGYDAGRLGFAEAWKAVVAATDRLTSDRATECEDCPYLLLCGYCPALFALEQGSPSEPSEYVCRLGESRFRAMARYGVEVEYAR